MGASKVSIGVIAAGVGTLCILAALMFRHSFASSRVHVSSPASQYKAHHSEHVTQASSTGGVSSALSVSGPGFHKHFWGKVDAQQEHVQTQVNNEQTLIQHLFERSRKLTHQETDAVRELKKLHRELQESGGYSVKSEDLMHEDSLHQKIEQCEKRKANLKLKREQVGTQLRELEMQFMVNTFRDMAIKFEKMLHMEGERVKVVEAYQELAEEEGKDAQVTKFRQVKELLLNSEHWQEAFKEHLDDRVRAYSTALNVSASTASSL